MLTFRKAIGFFKGEAELYVDASGRDRAASAVAEISSAARIEEGENGGIKIFICPGQAKKIASALDKSGIIVYINSVCGIKNILYRLKKRVGLLVGLALALFILAASTSVVFRVDVVGAEGASTESIENELSALGVRVGVRIRDIDRAKTVSRFLKLHPEYSWAALNVDGTTLTLMLRTRTEGEQAQMKTSKALVAASDGVITEISVYSGKSEVRVGDVVRKGDLLISGYVSGNGLQYTDDPKLRFEGASGKVYAEVRESLTVRVPLERTETVRVPIGRTGITLSVLGKTFTFGNVTEDESSFLTEKRYLTLFSAVTLPITYRVCVRTEQKQNVYTADAVEATLTARAEAYRMLSDVLGEASLTETEMITGAEDGAVLVTLNYGCVRLISSPLEG